MRCVKNRTLDSCHEITGVLDNPPLQGLSFSFSGPATVASLKGRGARAKSYQGGTRARSFLATARTCTEMGQASVAHHVRPDHAGRMAEFAGGNGGVSPHMPLLPSFSLSSAAMPHCKPIEVTDSKIIKTI